MTNEYKQLLFLLPFVSLYSRLFYYLSLRIFFVDSSPLVSVYLFFHTRMPRARTESALHPSKKGEPRRRRKQKAMFFFFFSSFFPPVFITGNRGTSFLLLLLLADGGTEKPGYPAGGFTGAMPAKFFFGQTSLLYSMYIK